MSEERIEAVVLAGGEGTRLKSYTAQIPKPLVTLDGMPVLEVVLRRLARFGFRRVAITLAHGAGLIRANFSDGAHLGLRISYAEEETPLGTAGPLGSLEGLAEQFLVLNGDLLTDLDLRRFFQSHLDTSATLTIAAHERSVPVEFGVIEGEGGRVSGYVEKPMLRYLVSMGIYAFDRRVLRYVEPGRRLDFPELVLRLLEAGTGEGEGEVVDVRYYPFDGYWLDIGSEGDYERARDEFPRLRAGLLGE